MVVKYVLVAAVSAGVGYFVANYRLERLYFERLQEIEEEAQGFYRSKYKKQAEEDGEDPEITESAVDAAEALKTYQGLTVPPAILTEKVTASVKRDFESGIEEAKSNVAELATALDPVVADGQLPGKTDYNKISAPKSAAGSSESVKSKTPAPDIISLEEFVNSESGYKQFSITYFAGDDVLAGESDQVIELEARNVDLGDEIVQKLKIGREAMNGLDALYVRNHERQVEFDIARSPGKYSEETKHNTSSG